MPARRIRFEHEHQVYLQALGQAQRLQLLLPMDGLGRRIKAVDACILEETALTGAKKICLRNEREHTWLGDGFGLMALHRPAFAGSGDNWRSVDLCEADIIAERGYPYKCGDI